MGTFYQAAKTLHVQYREDEGTFVTVINEQDVNDTCTLVETQKSTLSPRNKRRQPCEASKCLSFDDDLEEEEEIGQIFSAETASSSELTPYQRYRKKIEDDIERKTSALLDDKRKEHDVQSNIL